MKRDSHSNHFSYISSCAAKITKKIRGVIAEEWLCEIGRGYNSTEVRDAPSHMTLARTGRTHALLAHFMGSPDTTRWLWIHPARTAAYRTADAIVTSTRVPKRAKRLVLTNIQPERSSMVSEFRHTTTTMIAVIATAATCGTSVKTSETMLNAGSSK